MADAGHRLFRRLTQPEADETVLEMRTDQEFSGEVGDHLGAHGGAGDRVERRDISIEDALADGMRQRHVPVVASGVRRDLRC
jgi:hypothetical protein